MPRRLVYAVLAAATLAVVVSAAAADTVAIPDQVFRGDPGEVFHAGTIPAVAGDQCTTTLEYTNNAPELSDHPGTDILVGPVTFPDVEHGARMAAGLTFTATGPVDVALRLGSDGVSSGGYLVEVTCNPPNTTTTSAPEPSTTTTTVNPVTTTVPSATTTTEPPPINGVDTGGGSCADGACERGNGPLLAGLLAMLGAGLLIGGVRKATQ